MLGKMKMRIILKIEGGNKLDGRSRMFHVKHSNSTKTHATP